MSSSDYSLLKKSGVRYGVTVRKVREAGVQPPETSILFHSFLQKGLHPPKPCLTATSVLQNLYG